MLGSLARLFAVPNKLALLELFRGMRCLVRMRTIDALHASGMLALLREPKTADEVIAALGSAKAS